MGSFLYAYKIEWFIFQEPIFLKTLTQHLHNSEFVH